MAVHVMNYHLLETEKKGKKKKLKSYIYNAQ